MHHLCIVVLCILNQKYHQERDDGRTRVDDKLPSIGKTKDRPGQGPNHNDQDGDAERPRTTQHVRAFASDDMKNVLHATEEVAPTRLCFAILNAVCDSNLSSRLRNNLRA